MIKEIGSITKSLLELDEFCKLESASIDSWIRTRAGKQKYEIYNSVDIRCSGFKIAPVDTNIFPAGFHLLDKREISDVATKFRHFIDANFPGSSKLLLIPEGFNRNLHYLKNVSVLVDIFKKAKFDIRVGSSDIVYKNADLHIEKIVKEHRDIFIESDSYSPDVIILNNDLTSGIPDILKDIKKPIVPSLNRGWYLRRKSHHMRCYYNIASEFCKHFNFDPWLITTEVADCNDINFKDQNSIDRLRALISGMLDKIRKGYDDRSLDEKPYVFIKADNGTFGMGITNTEEINSDLFFNKKMRNSMFVIKDGVKNEAVLLQEGVKTAFTFQDFAAESMFYFANGNIISTIVRYNTKKNNLSNLNSTGMKFENAFDLKNLMPLYHVQAVVAKLAVLAVLYEFL
ncbi:glutamate--cysteine ligase [Candidatus Lariskella endosymbiont of Epinotia ramella]|uniref:glutamate--cysteine ligase n=1 Tax=Candidatus Lariskella endosymbiont of Epinotia ramella TaxID=3066224 RepID=UPI0030D20A4C